MGWDGGTSLQLLWATSRNYDWVEPSTQVQYTGGVNGSGAGVALQGDERGNDRHSIDWSTGDYTHTWTYNQLLHQRMIPWRTAQNKEELCTVEKSQCGLCVRQWSWRQSTNHTHRPQPAISGQCRSSKWETERAAGEKFEFRPQGPLVYCRFTFLYFIYYDYDCQRALNCCLNLQKGKSFFLRAVKQHISLSAIASVAYRDII